MKACRGSTGIAPLILNLGTKWMCVCVCVYVCVCGKLHALASVSPGKNPGIHGVGCYMGTRNDLDVFKREKMSCPYLDSNPRLSIL